jgi:hypothetical protein
LTLAGSSESQLCGVIDPCDDALLLRADASNVPM